MNWAIQTRLRTSHGFDLAVTRWFYQPQN